MDDVLGGLDNTTEHHVFHNLLGHDGLLRQMNTTVVIVSSSGIFTNQMVNPWELSNLDNSQTAPILRPHCLHQSKRGDQLTGHIHRPQCCWGLCVLILPTSP